MFLWLQGVLAQNVPSFIVLGKGSALQKEMPKCFFQCRDVWGSSVCARGWNRGGLVLLCHVSVNLPQQLDNCNPDGFLQKCVLGSQFASCLCTFQLLLVKGDSTLAYGLNLAFNQLQVYVKNLRSGSASLPSIGSSGLDSSANHESN